METKIFPAADPATPALAARIIRSGGLVAIPTETVYGLGARRPESGGRGQNLHRQGPPPG